MAVRVGDWIGKYRIERTLGAGGFGTVFQAAHRETGRLVAIKDVPGAVDEAKRLAQMDRHENLVPVLDVIDRRFLVMDFLRGDTLEDWRQANGPFTAALWWPYFVGLLEGVNQLHRHGLVHRDIKPDNIMVVGDRLVLVDFGAARPAGVNATLIGTRRYAPPEYYHGFEKGVANPAWDIYSLAVVSFDMLFDDHESSPDEMIESLAISEVHWVRGLADGLKAVPADRPRTLVGWVCRMVPCLYGADASSSDFDVTRQSEGRSESVSGASDTSALSSETHAEDLWDTATLASLRDRIVDEFSLPRQAVAFLSPEQEAVRFNAQVGTLCSRWTDEAQLRKPQGSVPRRNIEGKSVSWLKSKVAAVYGLPQGSVTVLQPNGDPYHGGTHVRTVCREHSEYSS